MLPDAADEPAGDHKTYRLLSKANKNLSVLADVILNAMNTLIFGCASETLIQDCMEQTLAYLSFYIESQTAPSSPGSAHTDAIQGVHIEAPSDGRVWRVFLLDCFLHSALVHIRMESSKQGSSLRYDCCYFLAQ